jgi:hypothetical protein
MKIINRIVNIEFNATTSHPTCLINKQRFENEPPGLLIHPSIRGQIK